MAKSIETANEKSPETEANSADEAAPVKSYDEILKSTSIIGGSQAINYVIGMVRVKLVAILLGPEGVGLVGSFQSSIRLVGQLTGLGVGSSGVRQIAKANGSGDTEQIGRTVRVLRRACWATGIAGWVVAAILSKPLSVWAFESAENAWLIAILGASLLLVAVSDGQKAIIQGTRRIADLARLTVLASILSTMAALVIYYFLGTQGIVSALISTAALNLGVSWWFAKKVEVPDVATPTLAETYQEGKELTNVGIAFMWGGLLTALVDMAVRALIVREVGVDGTGYYQAAWALSGMFANFILGAMGKDFYPRLTGVVDNHSAMRSMVDEQIEIGILIAVPGLLATLALGPLLLITFYSSAFVAAAEVLPWFVFGIFFRVLSWPIGFSILAKGATRWLLFTQTTYHSVNILLAWFLIAKIGVVGAGIGFFGSLIAAVCLNFFVANRLIGYVWSPAAIKLIIAGASVVTLSFLGALFLPAVCSAVLSVPLAIAAGIVCLRGIVSRVGNEHRIVKTLKKIPGMHFILPS